MNIPQSKVAFFKRHRRKILLSFTGLLLLSLVGGYWVWSSRAWGDYTPAYNSWQQNIRSDVEKASVLPVGTPDERAVVMTTYSGIEKHISATKDQVCAVHGLVQWQTTFDSLKQQVDECEKSITKVEGFDEKLQKTTSFLSDDESLSKVISEIPQPEELGEKSWQGQVDAWNKAAEKVRGLSVGEAYKPTQQLAIDRVAEIKNAWQELIAANKTQDKQKFTSAQAGLNKAYDKMNDIIVSSQEGAITLASDLQSTYSHL